MRIALYGPGRLGGTLALLLPPAGHEVVIWRRGQTHPHADLRWLTVPDAAIASVALGLPDDAPVLHASGATDLQPLAHLPEHGSLHLLQSFPGAEVSIPTMHGVVAAIAGSPRALALARQIALDLGARPVLVPGDRRMYHAAAVMAGNFATVLLEAASQVLSQAGVPKDLAPAMLAPLALSSLSQALTTSPAQALTGPFARGDQAVIESHRRALSEHQPELLALYDVLAHQARALANDFPSAQG